MQNKTYYEAYGPFEMPIDGRLRRVLKDSVKSNGEFWNDVEGVRKGLSTAFGIYVFSTEGARGVTPWYIGQARGLNGFKQELFTARNQLNYHEILAKKKSETPLLHLLPRITKTHRLSRQSNKQELDWIERMLIGLAFRQNSDLINVRGVGVFKNMSVPGILGKGKRGTASRGIKTLRMSLGLD